MTLPISNIHEEKKFTTKRNRRKRLEVLAHRNLLIESLEARQLLAVSSLWFSGSKLVVQSDNLPTHVTVESSSGLIRVNDLSTSRSWSYSSSSVRAIEFQGGSSNDRFLNNVSTLPTLAFGGAGNDYLEGYNAVDEFYGGDGDDTLVGYGSNDRLVGGNGNDIIRGMDGDDSLSGQADNDRIEGGSGNDVLWGSDGNDILLGGSGNDQLVGGNGDDELNGQAGADRLWGEAGRDNLVSLDAAFAEYVDGGMDGDTLWIDSVGSSRDNVISATSADKVHAISSFANGADKTLDGDRIADPKAVGTDVYKTFANRPLFSSSGPHMNDVVQGALGDCYFLAGLSGIALDSPQAIRQNIVDFQDGTYGVRLSNKFYRVDNDLPVSSTNSLTPAYAQFGGQGSMWVAIYEKAFAHDRRGENSYASIEGGWAIEANRALGAAVGASWFSGYRNATALVTHIHQLYSSFQAVTVGFIGNNTTGARVIMNHMYTVVGFTFTSTGAIASVILRNPWGRDGVGSDGANDGRVQVTPQQLFGLIGQVNWGRVT